MLYAEERKLNQVICHPVPLKHSAFYGPCTCSIILWCARTHTHTKCIRTQIYVHPRAHTHTHTRTHTHTHTYKQAHTHTHAHTHTQAAAKQAPKLSKEEMQEMRRRNDPNFGKEAGKDAWKKADANKPGKGAAASKMSGQRCVQETCICVCGCVCGWVGGGGCVRVRAWSLTPCLPSYLVEIPLSEYTFLHHFWCHTAYVSLALNTLCACRVECSFLKVTGSFSPTRTHLLVRMPT